MRQGTLRSLNYEQIDQEVILTTNYHSSLALFSDAFGTVHKNPYIVRPIPKLLEISAKNATYQRRHLGLSAEKDWNRPIKPRSQVRKRRENCFSRQTVLLLEEKEQHGLNTPKMAKINLGNTSIARSNVSEAKLNDSDSESENSEKMMTPSSSSKALKRRMNVTSDDEEGQEAKTRAREI